MTDANIQFYLKCIPFLLFQSKFLDISKAIKKFFRNHLIIYLLSNLNCL